MALTTKVKIPEEIVELLGESEKTLPRRIEESLALQLYLEGRVSMGKAAELLDLTVSEFLKLMRRRKIKLRYTARDLKKDAETLDRALA
jgi:predicted HTH domain antitoxin